MDNSLNRGHLLRGEGGKVDGFGFYHWLGSGRLRGFWGALRGFCRFLRWSLQWDWWVVLVRVSLHDACG